MTSRRAALTLLLALPVAACDPQSDGGYKGEPLVTMTGTVEGTGAAPVPAGVDLVVAYFVEPADPYTEFCIFDAKAAFDQGQAPDLGCRFQHLAPERVEVVGQFPAAFQFALLHPPPAAALTDSGNGFQVALADIFAVKKGSADDGVLELGDLIGYSPEFLVWIDRNVAPDDVCRQAPDGTISCAHERVAAGFHVARALCGSDQSVEPDTVCAALVDGQPITVELSDLATIVQASVSTWTAP